LFEQIVTNNFFHVSPGLRILALTESPKHNRTHWGHYRHIKLKPLQPGA